MTKHQKTRKKLPNIARVDYPEKRTYGWRVQVIIKRVVHKKFFSDSVHGGKKKALDAAIQYRDSIKEQVEINQYLLWRRSIVRKNNTSGIVGVGRYVRSDDKNGDEAASWQAFWDDPSGKRKSRKFSVKLYGEEQARLLAIKERKKQLRKIYKKN